MFKNFADNLPAHKIMNRNYVRLTQETGLFDCLFEMLKKNRSEALIVRELAAEDTLANILGIVTESDVGRHISKDENQPLVRDILSADLITISPKATARQARDVMIKNGIGRIVIVKDRLVKGIITVRELLNTFYLQLDEVETKLMSVLENVREAICFIDHNGTVIFWNKASEKLYNVPKQTIIGKHISKSFPNALLLKSLEDKKAYENVKHSPADGVSAVISTMPVMIDGKFIGVVSTDKDESELTNLSKELERQRQELSQLKRQVRTMSNAGFSAIIGTSPRILEAVKLSKQVAKTNANILITGESGTGKEVFAEAIHKESGRNGSFVPINCAAIPSSLLESELFGYEAGSFTGGLKSGRAGKFELADNGTLFLDEIGDMPLEMQAKLLRVLQDGVVIRIGGSRQRTTDTRIICATNKDLKELMKKGAFREDLFYRINVMMIELPPLRRRREDIPLLAIEFIKEFSQKNNLDVIKISQDALAFLTRYEWSGNIRELRNTIERLVILCGSGTIEKEDLSRDILMAEIPVEIGEDITSGKFHLEKTVAEFEKSSIMSALALANGNKAKAAELLHINRSNLYYKMGLYGISV